MKNQLRVLGRLALIWLMFFEATRVIFFLYQFDLLKGLSLYELVMPLILGLRMDLAMTAYWLIIPGLALTVSFFVSDAVIAYILTISFYLLALFSCLVITADFELYHHWNFRMDTTPLFYAGSEGVGSVSVWVVIKLVLIFCGLILSLHLAFYRWVRPRLFFPVGGFNKVFIMLLVTGLLFIPIRSSFSVAPLNTGVVYFHKTKSFPNHAGINVVWNFLKSLVSDNAFKYPADFLEAKTAQTVFSGMMAKSDSAVKVLNTSRPNIVLIILESFTSKIVEPLGGLKNITPNLNSLCSEGILFESFYASGDRTDKGIVSILSGYPAQPKTSIIKYPNKAESLPSLPRSFATNGYHTSFVYGGDVGFANMESYLNSVGFTHITEDDDFDFSLNTSKWGVHDEFVFGRLLSELDTANSPFFKVMLSLSSHEPFDVPFGNSKSKSEEALFLNSCSYTDSVLGIFISESKKKAWWKNSLVIIAADHGHRNPGLSQSGEKAKFKIPMLWIGGAVDTVIRMNRIGSQTDMAATLLNQVGLPSEQFTFSKDLFSPYAAPFAIYTFNNGYGYIERDAEVIYDFDYSNYMKNDSAASDNLRLKGKAFMQMLFSDYNKR